MSDTLSEKKVGYNRQRGGGREEGITSHRKESESSSGHTRKKIETNETNIFAGFICTPHLFFFSSLWITVRYG